MAKEDTKQIKSFVPSLVRLIGRYQSERSYILRMSQSQARVLQSLVAYNRPITVNELSDCIGSARSTTSEIVKRMVKKKLVSHRRDDVDARRVFIEPAKKGLDILKAREETVGRKLEEIVGRMSTAERSEFMTAHKSVAKLVEKGVL